jgi:predicted dinucleotide-binding enzyme
MRVAVLGAGAVGSRAARQLASTPSVRHLVVADVDRTRAASVVSSIADPGRVTVADAPADEVGRGMDVVVLALAPGAHLPLAERCLERGASVVSTSDQVEDVTALLALDAEARERALRVVVGGGFAPGLTCVLAAHAAETFDVVDEVHVAKVGTGGPACARQHHDALAGVALDWRDGGWVRRRGGSGRELCWFPDPVGPADCYRAALPDALLLGPAFPGARRITARVGANRRDRFTARLPMLRRPHPERWGGRLGWRCVGVEGGRVKSPVLGGPWIGAPGVGRCDRWRVAAVWITEGLAGGRVPGGYARAVSPFAVPRELARRGVRRRRSRAAGARSAHAGGPRRSGPPSRGNSKRVASTVRP